MSAVIEVRFPVLGTALPSDHAYALYGALSRRVPGLHGAASPVRVVPVNGLPGGPGLLRLDGRSRLRLRLPADEIPLVLPLAGARLEVAGHVLRLVVPEVAALEPAATVQARFVTVRLPNGGLGPEAFLTAVRAKLDAADIGGELMIPVIRSGSKAGERFGEPRRRVLRVQGRRVVGYMLRVAGLTAEESLRLQAEGLGGRRRMGGGFFVPWREGT